MRGVEGPSLGEGWGAHLVDTALTEPQRSLSLLALVRYHELSEKSTFPLKQILINKLYLLAFLGSWQK